MKVGDCVINQYHSIIRYGKITKSYPNYKNDGWTWFDVEWFDDARYESAMSSRKQFLKEDMSLKKYRADYLLQFNLEKTIQTLNKLK
tara:strand:+ start:78 stop:338 length:261 start_codon:yes stop_codon:yes gene_type:complete